MTFAQPLFLFALSALAIPVIIHLFNFRRYKKVWFTNVRFLTDIKQENRKRSQLKHLLILLMRLLAVAALVIAFAQPYFSRNVAKAKPAGRQAVSIYIDNSFSMEALSPDGRLLDQARQKALEIVRSYSPADRFQLLTNDFEGRHQRFMTPDEFKTALEEVKISPVTRKVSEVMRRQSDLLGSSGSNGRSAFLLSDFQRSSSDLTSLQADTATAFYFVPLETNKLANLSFDSAWFESPIRQPGQSDRLHIRIRNSGEEAMEKIPVKLTVNGTQKALASCSAEPGSFADLTLPFTNNPSGIQSCVLSLTDFPVTRDDRFYLSFSLSPSLPVLCINGGAENVYLNALFQGDSNFVFRNEPAGRLDYSSFSRYPLILLNGVTEIPSGLSQELTRFLNNGGSLMIFPAEKPDLVSYRSFLETFGAPVPVAPDTARQRISFVNTESPVYHGVFESDGNGKVLLPENTDLPVALRYFTAGRPAGSAAEDLLRLQNGRPFLTVTPAGKGKLYLCQSPADDRWSSFPKHTLFVPTLYRIALLSQPSPPLYYSASADLRIALQHDSAGIRETYRIRNPETEYEFIPEVKTIDGAAYLFPHDRIPDAGNYLVLAGTQPLQGISVNYDRRESDLECYSPAELQDALKRTGVRDFSVFRDKNKPVTRLIEESGMGTPAWKYFIILALLALLGEILLVRLMKN